MSHQLNSLPKYTNISVGMYYFFSDRHEQYNKAKILVSAKKNDFFALELNLIKSGVGTREKNLFLSYLFS